MISTYPVVTVNVGKFSNSPLMYESGALTLFVCSESVLNCFFFLALGVLYIHFLYPLALRAALKCNSSVTWSSQVSSYKRHHNAEWRGRDDLASYVFASIKTLKRYLLFNLSTWQSPILVFTLLKKLLFSGKGVVHHLGDVTFDIPMIHS